MMNRKLLRLLTAVAPAALLLLAATGSAIAQNGPGAVFTTTSACDGTNLNIYSDKGDVYLDGGPAHPGAAGLEDGNYYVRVTTPDGTVLGYSTSASVLVTGGEFAQCYRLVDILLKISDGSAGFDDSTNGEYKVWASKNAGFDNGTNKTDNFKVQEGGGDPQSLPTLNVLKFYDANANGINDDGQLIAGWQVRIQDGLDITRETPVSIILAPDDYVVTESDTIETNWLHTTTNPVDISLANGETKTVEFGNVCLGAGGGLTLGFWSNKNGQALVGSDDLAMLTALNLRAASGAAFDPGNYSALRTWLLNATATNMSYMLSAQLAAMELNVFNGKVNGSALIYAPGTQSANSLGFATVDALMAEADTELGLHGLVLADSPYRAYQEALKTALDKGNNNLNFVQATPCSFSFNP